MSVVTVICPACTKRFDVPESYRGREGKCTSCGAPLRVPLTGDVVSASAEQLASFGSALSPQPGPPQPMSMPVGPPQPAPIQPMPMKPVALAQPQPAADQVTIGRQLGRYELQSKLGGATSTVFRAQSPDGSVAVKVLPAEVVAKNATVGKRFLREARTLFNLNHANVVRSLDAGEELGSFFLVMELVAAPDLRAVLAAHGGRLAEAEVLRIALGIAAGLEFLSQHNLVHRNLMPEHVLFDEDDFAVKLVGLGLVRAEGDGGAAGPQVTVKGAVVGTPGYMSPEQARADELDHRSDLYQVGIVLYELLTGELPFQAKAVAQILRALTQDPCPDVREKAPQTSEGLAAVIRKLTEKKPEDRYQTAKELLTDIRAVRSGDLTGGLPPIAAMAVGTGVAKRKTKPQHAAGAAVDDDPTKRLKLIAAGLGLLVLILIVALAVVMTNK
ncbi:MAG: serine/threonine-protein kinase [Planctomycetota bacterium]